MTGQLQPDGSILVETRAQGEQGELGDVRRLVRPGDRGYDRARADLERDQAIDAETEAAIIAAGLQP